MPSHLSNMRYKFAFSHTRNGIFRIHIVPNFESSKSRRHFFISYPDEQIFLDLLADVDIGSNHRAHIVELLVASAQSPGTPACCDELSLTDEQLLILLNGAIRARTA